ncbi:MAG: hypothetical protein ACK55Z_26355 [bacterium]
MSHSRLERGKVLHVQVFRILSLNRNVFVIVKKNILGELAARPVVELIKIARRIWVIFDFILIVALHLIHILPFVFYQSL